MISDYTIRMRKKQIRDLGNKLMYLQNKYDNDIIVSTRYFYNFGQNIFKVSCQNDLTREISIECIYDDMKNKWCFFEKGTGERINKSITKIFNDFVRECRKHKPNWR